MEVKQSSSMELPEAFIDFLNKNGLDPSIYTATDSTPRFIRLKPGCEVFLEGIEAEIKCKLQKVEWLLNFYSLPPHVQIANSKAYREGKISSMELMQHLELQLQLWTSLRVITSLTSVRLLVLNYV